MALAGPIAIDSISKTPTRDRSYEAVARQLKGMGAERYQVTLKDRSGQVKAKREWTAGQMLESVSWLKRMNARGQNVEVTPLGAHRLVCIDAEDAAAIGAMHGLGLAACARIESKVKGTEYWIVVPPLKHSARQQDINFQRTLLSGAVKKQHGRLAGFVHHVSDAHIEQGQYVLAHDPQGAVSTARPDIADKVALGLLQTASISSRTKSHLRGSRHTR